LEVFDLNLFVVDVTIEAGLGFLECGHQALRPLSQEAIPFIFLLKKTMRKVSSSSPVVSQLWLKNNKIN